MLNALKHKTLLPHGWHIPCISLSYNPLSFKTSVANIKTLNYLALTCFSRALSLSRRVSLLFLFQYLWIVETIFFIPILTLSSVLCLHFTPSLCFHLLILFKSRRRGFSLRRVTQRVGGRQSRAESSWQERSARLGSARLDDCSVLVWTWTPQQRERFE